MQKRHITAEELLRDSFELGARVIESGFRPKWLAAIWRGGAPVGIAVHELLQHCGICADYFAIGTSSYRGMGKRGGAVEVRGLGEVARRVRATDAMLIVDDIYDTGLSVAALLDELQSRAGDDTPRDIRIAAPWFKPCNNRTRRAPDYHIHQTADWLVFPHEVRGLTPAEIAQNKPTLAPILHRLTPYTVPERE
ncbi:MAG: phosphoribosyltransferase family protein [Deltaproteobacteria bacterium]|nr:phosphoribosyltransferase family protein [Deltaproteobacteria bacterium]